MAREEKWPSSEISLEEALADSHSLSNDISVYETKIIHDRIVCAVPFLWITKLKHSGYQSVVTNLCSRCRCRQRDQRAVQYRLAAPLWYCASRHHTPRSFGYDVEYCRSKKHSLRFTILFLHFSHAPRSKEDRESSCRSGSLS